MGIMVDESGTNGWLNHKGKAVANCDTSKKCEESKGQCHRTKDDDDEEMILKVARLQNCYGSL